MVGGGAGDCLAGETEEFEELDGTFLDFEGGGGGEGFQEAEGALGEERYIRFALGGPG